MAADGEVSLTGRVAGGDETEDSIPEPAVEEEAVIADVAAVAP